MNKIIKTEKYILLLKGIAIGILTGVTIGAFRLMISGIESIRINIENMNYIAIAVFFLIIYLVICACLKVDKNCSGSGFPRVKGELAGKIETDWLKDMVTMMVASSCSIGAGLSMGKIGPSAHIGAMIAKGFSKNTKKMKSDDRLFMTAGAGAGCAAILHAPLAGIAFTLEETNKSSALKCF